MVDIFRASGVVAYVAADGMGIAFGLVEAEIMKSSPSGCREHADDTWIPRSDIVV
jgi:hypothetical protein